MAVNYNCKLISISMVPKLEVTGISVKDTDIKLDIRTLYIQFPEYLHLPWMKYLARNFLALNSFLLVAL